MIIERKNVALSFWKMTFLLCCVLTSVSFISLKAAAEDFDESCYRLPVFQTSDIHGHLAYIDGETPEYRLAYISDKVKDVRGYGDNARKDKALLLDAGDIYQGYPMSALNGGQPLSKAFTIMGYDAVAVGNHEFDWDVENVVDFKDRTMFDPKDGEYAAENLIPVVTSNFYQNGEKVTFTKDYVILEKTAVDGDGKEMTVRIAVIGFAGKYADDIAYNKFTGRGFTIDMDYGKLNTLASELESADKCDATIVLAHEDPKTIAEGLGEGSVVDLVLGGHVHDNTQGTTSWGLPYVEPAYHAEAYTYSELVFEKASDTAATFKGVDKANYVPVDLTKTYKPENWADIENQQDQDNQIDLDPELVKMSDYCIEQVGQQLAEKLGYITEEALKGEFHPEKGERASGAGNFVAWLYAKMVGAQVGFVNHGGIRAEFVLEEGKDQRDIIVNDVYTLFPFDNKIYCFEITYEDLLQVFQYAVSTGGAKLLSHMVGVDCYYTGKTVNAIITPDGKKAYANGKWFDNWKNQKIRVAMSEYMATKNRKEEGDPDNPFCTWLNTDRLISKDTIDAEGALSVLRSEAGENEGHLKIDNHTYYINEEYPDEKTPETDPTPGTDPAADSGKQTSQKNETEAAEGSQHTVGAGTYKISSAKNKTVTFVKAKASAASIKVPASVKISGKTYNVNKIGTKAFKGSKAKKVTIGANVTTIQKNAFKGSKATTIIIKTKKLKKAKVKGSLKGSKVKTIKVKVGKKKINKKYVKKYKKIFTKKNAGKKVTVK